jgi:hypothetical protein
VCYTKFKIEENTLHCKLCNRWYGICHNDQWNDENDHEEYCKKDKNGVYFCYECDECMYNSDYKLPRDEEDYSILNQDEMIEYNLNRYERYEEYAIAMDAEIPKQLI